MKNSLRARIIDQLLSHLEEMDAEELRPKPEAVAVEMSVEKDPMLEEASALPSDEGPMKDLMKDETGVEGDPDEEELSDEDLEELEGLY